MLGIIALGPDRERQAGELSHGQKQWLEIGMVLVQDPDVLLMDEPAAGMTDAETLQTDGRSAETPDNRRPEPVGGGG